METTEIFLKKWMIEGKKRNFGNTNLGVQNEIYNTNLKKFSLLF